MHQEVNRGGKNSCAFVQDRLHPASAKVFRDILMAEITRKIFMYLRRYERGMMSR